MEKMRGGALRSLLQRCHWMLSDLCLDRVKSHLEYLREPHRVTLGSDFSKKTNLYSGSFLTSWITLFHLEIIWRCGIFLELLHRGVFLLNYSC